MNIIHLYTIFLAADKGSHRFTAVTK